MRNIYWDKLMVVDDEFNTNLLEKLIILSNSVDYEKSGIRDENNELNTVDSNYVENIIEDVEISKLVENEIDRLNILPIEKKLRNGFYPKFNKLEKGGNLARHQDYNYSFALTLYFNKCEGGELKVENGDGQNLLIEPKKNRLVLLKGDNPHQVNTVTGGIRKSLQVFIGYNNENRSST